MIHSLGDALCIELAEADGRPGGGPTDTPLIPSGILIALDADTGMTLWQFNLGAPVGIGGPSIGNGMLLVPTGHIQNPNAGGYIVAFGLPAK